MHTENVSSFHFPFLPFFLVIFFCSAIFFLFLYISIFAECNQSFVKNEMEQIEEKNETIFEAHRKKFSKFLCN